MPLRLGGAHDVGLARAKGAKKSAVARPSQQGVACGISTSCPGSGSCPSFRAADATACSRVILACASNSSRPPGASNCSSQPSARWMDLAAGGLQERLAFHVPHATRAIPRSRTRTWARDFAASAVNRFIDSGGTLTFGAAVPTGMRCGTAVLELAKYPVPTLAASSKSALR